MDRKVVGAVLFRVVAVVTSPTAAECSVVWCGVGVVVVAVFVVVVVIL